MSFDDILFAVITAGFALSLAFFRAAYRQWRFDQARHSRRLSNSQAVPRASASTVAPRRCMVLDFKDACARKGRHTPTVNTAADADFHEPRQRSNGAA